MFFPAAHYNPMSGHLEYDKTLDRIMTRFYLPGIHADVKPLDRSVWGYRFVLVLVDYATRYPEAVPLRNISAKSVAQALFHIISRVGMPKEILTDQVKNIYVTHTARAE